MDNYVITLSRQFASLGRSIAQQLAEELDIEFYDRDLVETVAKRMGQPVSIISSEEENAHHEFFKRKYPLGMGLGNMKDEIFSIEKNIIQDLASKESCIIVGRCAESVLKDHPRKLSIYIYASQEERMDNCVKVLQMDRKQARKMMKDVDKAREMYHKLYSDFGANPYDAYDIMIDSGAFGIHGTVAIIKSITDKKFS